MTIPEAITELWLLNGGFPSANTPQAIRMGIAALEIVGAMAEKLGADLLREVEHGDE